LAKSSMVRTSVGYQSESHPLGRVVERSFERRGAVRYELRIAVAFFWENAEGDKFQAEGVTRDISEVGVYVLSGTCPPLKSKVRVEVTLAQPGIVSGSLKGRMQVLRVERDGPEEFGGCGFALGGTPLSLSDAAHA
jgi:hypothetical protein